MNQAKRSTNLFICRVADCPYTSENKPELTFFPIPMLKRKAWLERIDPEGTNKKTSWVICSEHFNEDEFVIVNNRKTIPQYVLPSKNLPIDTDDDVIVVASTSNNEAVVSKLTQTDYDYESLYNSKITSDDATTLYKLCDTFFTTELAMLLRSRDCLQYKIDEFKLFTNEYLRPYFDLYKKSPQSYNFVQHMHDLPKGDVLLKKFIRPGTKIQHEILSILKARVNKMSPREKYCSLLIKSVDIKASLCYNIKEDKIYGFEEINEVQTSKPAKTTFIAMVKGIFANWKQPIGYAMFSQDCNENIVTNWIDELVRDLFKIGFDLRSCVLGTKENHLYKNIVTTDMPFMIHEDKMIYLIFDALDLINSIRNIMQTHDFHFQNKVAKYKDIIKFYEVDQQRTMPYAHTLTENHIYPQNEHKQDVKYAVQLMSRTVANGLGSYIHLGLLKDIDDESGTIEFITRINDLLDTLNVTRGNYDNENQRKRPLCEDTTQEEFLEEAIVFFQSLKVINAQTGQDLTSTTNFIDCIVISIKSILMLYKDMIEEGHNMLWTRNLQRMALDNYVKKMSSGIRGKSSKLTAWQISATFRKSFYLYTKRLLQGGRRKTDVKNFVAQIKNIHEIMELDRTGCLSDNTGQLSKDEKSHENADNTTESLKQVNKEVYGKINDNECHSLLYVSEFILTVVTKMHAQCVLFKKYLESNKLDLDSGNNKWQGTIINRPLVAVPCDYFIAYVQEMDKKFVNTLTKIHSSPIGRSLYEEMKEINVNEPPCTCFPKEFVIWLFIRIRIFYTIRLNNNEYKKNKQSHKTFMVKMLE